MRQSIITNINEHKLYIGLAYLIPYHKYETRLDGIILTTFDNEKCEADIVILWLSGSYLLDQFNREWYLIRPSLINRKNKTTLWPYVPKTTN